MGLSPLCKCSSPFSGNAKLLGAGVHLPIPLVEVRLPGVDGPVPRLSHPVPLINDLISSVIDDAPLGPLPTRLDY
jgi:hypothetical protein